MKPRLNGILRVLVTLAAMSLTSGTAFADTPSRYHFAIQWTSSSSAFFHGPPPVGSCGMPSSYSGWVGLDGAVTAPTVVATMNDPNSDHVLGWIEVCFNNGTGNNGTGDSGWMQGGWAQGTVGYLDIFGNCNPNACVRSTSGSHLYVEFYDLTSGFYSIYDYGALSSGASITHRIQYDPSSGCWVEYINYNQGAGIGCNWATSGSPGAGGEVYYGTNAYLNPAASPISLPYNTVGSSNPNTNQALRLEGAHGYAPWNTALTGGTTSSYDERYANLKYYISSFATYYYFKTCSLGTC